MAPRKNKPGGGRPRVFATELPVYDSMEQCAAATKVPISRLKIAKKEGCLFIRHGRVHFSEFIDFWFNRPAEEGKEEDENWDKRDKRAAALTKEAKLQEMYERVIDFDIAANFVEYLTGTLFFGEFERYAQEFPGSLKGKTEVEIQQEVIKQKEIVKKNIENSVKAWIKNKGKK
jgi:hypothetical protein